MANKRGPLSVDEHQFILENADELSVAEIAKELRRSEQVVRKHMAKAPKRQQLLDHEDFISQLHATPFWAEVKLCLLIQEIPYFEQQWAAYIKQFSIHDVMATDEMMTKDLILSDIMCNRCLQERAKIIKEIRQLERNIEAEMSKDLDTRDLVQLQDWNTRMAALIVIGKNTADELKEHQANKNRLMTNLKGNRLDRYKLMQEGRKNFFELIKTLDDMNERRKEGVENAKVAEAARRITADWEEYHEYDDGTVDAPLLRPEGVLKHG